ncbi:MAG: hypothetical protein V2J24_12260 [Pseudomonadales bacterium]|jgi:hypothetical protein|nr:hypothetical protein [Pseudomonadales bacterium]
MSLRNDSSWLLATATLLFLLGATAAPPSLAAGRAIAPPVPSASAYAERADAVRAALATGQALDDRAWERLGTAWRHTPDLATRLVTLARLQTRLAPPAPSLAQARLDAFAADLQGHRVLAAAGDSGHAEAVRALVERIRASGDGSATAPWRVASAGAAVAFLRELGEEPVGGYYGAPGPWRLTLVVAARASADGPATKAHFDLSETLAAWRSARAYSGATAGGRDARDFIAALAGEQDHFALTSQGLLTAAERGEGGHYRAARTLTRAADAGNAVARASLGDLYLQLADREPDVAGAAREAALAHHRAAAALGLGHAHLKLGMLARRAGDADAARAHLEFARAAGEQEAAMELAALLYPSEPGAAEALLRAAARAGDEQAAYELAVLRLEEADEDDDDAVALLAAAAAAGSDDARLFLGDLLATGRHVARDHARARALWASVARESTDVEAVLAAARALTLNDGTALHDPQAASAGVERLLSTERVAAGCAECWLVLAQALRASGEDHAAREVIAAGRRTLADARPLRSAAPGR